MNALIGCEFSAIVRDAFRSVGVDAWSCDFKESEGDSRWHIQGDVIEAIRSQRWDFIGVHPNCGAMSLSGNGTYGKGKPKHHLREEAILWTRELWGLVRASARFGYLENPRSVLWPRLNARSVQWIQPYQFGHGEQKATGLALHNLPPLAHTKLVEGREQRVWREPPGPNRKKNRSRTFSGVADAMAKQWGELLLRKEAV